MNDPQESFDEWLKAGIEAGHCGPPVCVCHDGFPSSFEEDESWIEGDEVCQFVMRAYASPEMKASVEENHSPSVWRDVVTG